MKYKLLTILAGCAMIGSHALAADPNADNTGKNERDASGATLTPIDQSNDPADLKLTADIRKAVVDNDKLSMNAKNAKIITIAGEVTLRGPVDSKMESNKLEKIAVKAGAKKVTNQLEVQAKK